jgi:o-succinylbenzoate---CoA ligase
MNGVDFSSQANTLLLNPRLQADVRENFAGAWKKFVDENLTSQIGIATSGSSGDAQGRLIVLSKAALQTSARAVNEHLGATSADIWFKALPDFHVGGLGILIRAELSGAKVFESRLNKWDAVEFVHEITAAGATLASLVPTQVFDLVQAKVAAPTQLRAIVVGGGRLEPSVHEAALALGWPCLVSYGLTECCSQVATARRPDDRRLFPLKHVQVRTNSADAADSSELGRIEIKSEALLTGQIVFANAGLTGAKFVRHQVGKWFQTEDCGSVEADGSLEISGRTVDFVKIGGEGVLLSRLQDRLERMRSESAFPDSVLLAVADERLGAKIVLLTVAEGSSAQGLMERFNQQVMPFERIRSVHRVSEIPRSPLGKLLRAEALRLL